MTSRLPDNRFDELDIAGIIDSQDTLGHIGLLDDLFDIYRKLDKLRRPELVLRAKIDGSPEARKANEKNVLQNAYPREFRAMWAPIFALALGFF